MYKVNIEVTDSEFILLLVMFKQHESRYTITILNQYMNRSRTSLARLLWSLTRNGFIESEPIKRTNFGGNFRHYFLTNKGKELCTCFLL